MTDRDRLRASIAAALAPLVDVLVDRLASQQPAPPAEYLTTSAAATVASVNEGTIRRWVRDGKIRGYRAGRVLRVRRDELDQMLATGRRSSANDESPEEMAVRAIANRRMR